jgi:hypothetical protein
MLPEHEFVDNMCFRVRVHVNIHVRTHMCTHGYIPMNVLAADSFYNGLTRVNIYVHVIHVPIDMHTYTHKTEMQIIIITVICMSVYADACVCVHIPTYGRTHARTHSHVFVHNSYVSQCKQALLKGHACMYDVCIRMCVYTHDHIWRRI